MKQLNLPTYSFKLKTVEQKKEIFDIVRKKYVSLTPEEWVRQNFVQYLIREKKFPASLFAIEMSFKLNRMQKRSDVVVFSTFGKPILIVECKSPNVKINQEVFEQITRYNMALKLKYLVVTNGIKHFYCLMNYKNNTYQFIKELPEYQLL